MPPAAVRPAWPCFAGIAVGAGGHGQQASGVRMRTTTVQIDAMKLAATLAGDDRLPPLLLLHGWPHCRHLYDPVIDALGGHAFAMAIDLPEVGESRGPPPSSDKATLADVAIAAAERLGGSRPVVAGIDVGGMIAYAAARYHGDRIAGAMVMNTAVPGLDPWDEVVANPAIWHFAFHRVPSLPEALVAGRQRAYFDYFIDALSRDRQAVGNDMRQRFAEAYQRPEALRAGFEWYRAMPEDAKRNRECVPFDTALAYVRGDADPANLQEYLAGLRAGGAVNPAGSLIPRSGELLPLENPSAFVATVLAFMRRANGSGH